MATEEAMNTLAPLMDNPARERVFEELCKLILLADVEDLKRFAPVITQVLPELKLQLQYDQGTHYHKFDLYTHTALVTAAMPEQLPLRWAALLHDIGKPDSRTEGDDGQAHYHGHAQLSAQMADDCLLRLKAPTALRERAVTLVDRHMVWFEKNKKVIRRWISRLGPELFEELITLQQADSMATGTAGPEEIAHFAEIHRLAGEILEEQSCLTLKDLAVKGNDLMEQGLRGRAIGETLNKLLTSVLEEELPNEKEALLRRVREELP
jgi:tRNA nucleotidyltransferase (CCA-adding enzyme)